MTSHQCGGSQVRVVLLAGFQRASAGNAVIAYSEEIDNTLPPRFVSFHLGGLPTRLFTFTLP